MTKRLNHCFLMTFLYILLVNHLFLHVNAFTTATKPITLSTNLIHRESLFPNQNNTLSKRLLQSSINRLKYLSNKINETVQPSLDPGTADYLFFVNFSIGQPPIPQLTGMDTGSTLIWVNCNTSCKHCGPVFDPSKSSTFVKIPCNNNTFCDHCNSRNECTYHTRYEDGVDSDGTIVTDRFTFDTSDEGITSIDDVLFGCGSTNGEFGGNATGMFGLAIGTSREQPYSIVKRLGFKFSYCVGNIEDHQYPHNKLIIGEGAVMEGYSTPIEIFDGFYYLTLEGISLGETRLEIDEDVFKRTSSTNGVIIDSGSSHTWLPQSVFDIVAGGVHKLCEGILAIAPSGPSDPDGLLCYLGNIERDLEGFPVLTFHFAEGADLVLDVYGMFVEGESGDRFCFSILPSDEITGDRTLIGMIAQQNYNVGYDVSGGRLYLERIDCELLDD